MPSSRLRLAGAAALTIAAASTAAVAGPLGPWHLTSAPVAAVSEPAADDAITAATTPDFGRRGRQGQAPAATVTLDQASSGQSITVKPGTEIDVNLTPDSGQRWTPPRSDRPQTVGRSHMGFGGCHHPRGGHQAGTPDLGRNHRGDGATQAVFYARHAGGATLSSTEHKGGLMFLMRPQPGGRAWSVKVTVSGPAPAPRPTPGPPAPLPHTPAIPGTPAAPVLDLQKAIAPVTSAVQQLGAGLPGR